MSTTSVIPPGMAYCTTCGMFHEPGRTACPISTPSPAMVPHRCPVCLGQKHVSKPPRVAGDVPTFLAGDTGTYPCPACAATGIVWGSA